MVYTGVVQPVSVHLRGDPYYYRQTDIIFQPAVNAVFLAILVGVKGQRDLIPIRAVAAF